MTGVSVRVAEDYDALSRAGAELVADVIRDRPTARVLVATGRTPMGAYRLLGEAARAGRLDASGITAYQLDEYVGLAPDDRRSLGLWAMETFVGPLGIAPERFVTLPLDGRESLRSYDLRVREQGGYDLAILGIGQNGHLGFNEPPSEAREPSREVTLSEASIASNGRYWGEGSSVPRRAVTVGMAPLLASRKILLMASGPEKRQIVERALLGPVTPEVPASFLRLAADVVVVLDRDAWSPGLDLDGGTR